MSSPPSVDLCNRYRIQNEYPARFRIFSELSHDIFWALVSTVVSSGVEVALFNLWARGSLALAAPVEWWTHPATVAWVSLASWGGRGVSYSRASGTPRRAAPHDALLAHLTFLRHPPLHPQVGHDVHPGRRRPALQIRPQVRTGSLSGGGILLRDVKPGKASSHSPTMSALQPAPQVPQPDCLERHLDAPRGKLPVSRHPSRRSAGPCNVT